MITGSSIISKDTSLRIIVKGKTMSDIFSGLESMGLGDLSKVDLFHDKREVKQKVETKEEPEKKLSEKDYIYDKNTECACCGFQFKEKTIRPVRMKAKAQDIDLRPKYEELDTLKYSIIACPRCGYAALNKEFSHLSNAQAKMIKEKISLNFTGLNQENDIYSYDEAISRSKLALINSIIKRGKVSERAYICLTLGWLTRGKAESLAVEGMEKSKILKQLSTEENDYLTKAAEGFEEALMKEVFPICGLEESTFIYLMSALNYETGRYKESLKYCERILFNRAVSDRIKDKVRRIKEAIQEIKDAEKQ